MLGIKRMDHVCWVVQQLDESLPFLTEMFGMRMLGRWENPAAGYNGATLTIPGSNVEWEVLEPSGDGSFLVKFLEERGPGLHHVTFEVESVAEANEALRSKGYKPMEGRDHESYKETFIHPKESGGVLFQLYEGGFVE